MKAVDYVRKGWTQGVSARDAEGKAVSSIDARATKWCAWGAMMAAAYPGGVNSSTRKKLHKVLQARFRLGPEEEYAYISPEEYAYISLAGWNDTPGRTQQEVIELLEEVERDEDRS